MLIESRKSKYRRNKNQSNGKSQINKSDFQTLKNGQNSSTEILLYSLKRFIVTNNTVTKWSDRVGTETRF